MKFLAIFCLSFLCLTLPLSSQAQTDFCGCTDTSACNYDPWATCDDGSCVAAPVSFLPDTLFICEEEVLNLDPNSNGESFLWSTGETQSTIQVSDTGTYSLIVQNSAEFEDNGDLPPYLPSEGLIGWYPFNGNAQDEGSNGLNAGEFGITYSEDRFGNSNSSSHFDGDSYLELPIDFDFPERSISLWFKADSLLPVQIIFSSDNHTIDNGFTIVSSTNNGLFWTAGVINFSNTTFLKETWYHVCISRSQDSTLYYFNGRLLSTTPSGFINTDFDEGLEQVVNIGCARGIDRFFHGSIDDVALYDRSLSSQEVSNLYLSQDFAFCEVSDSTIVLQGIQGCTNPNACNYDVAATCDDGTCLLPSACDSCSGETDGTGVLIDGDLDNDGICSSEDECEAFAGQAAFPDSTLSKTVCIGQEELIGNLIGLAPANSNGYNGIWLLADSQGDIINLGFAPGFWFADNLGDFPPGNYQAVFMNYGTPISPDNLFEVQNLSDYEGCLDFSEPLIISVTNCNCVNPFPAVDEASLSTTFTGNSYLTAWDAVAGQIGCLVAVRFAGGNLLGQVIVPGANASSFNIPGGVLSLNTSYEWRVRCGCSQFPLVVGSWSAWQPFTTPGGASIASSPNPTEGFSQVTFTLQEPQSATLEVMDMNGRMIERLFAGNASPDSQYRFDFDGSGLPNGVYIYRLTTNEEVITEKIMISK